MIGLYLLTLLNSRLGLMPSFVQRNEKESDVNHSQTVTLRVIASLCHLFFPFATRTACSTKGMLLHLDPRMMEQS